MAIAFDAAAGTSGLSNGTDPITHNHTCTGSDLKLIVCIATGDSADNVTGVTYNSVAMTRVGSITSGSGCRAYLYELVAPATGTHQVAVAVNTVRWTAVESASYTGCEQVAADQIDSDQGVVSTLTETVTTEADDSWVVGAFASTQSTTDITAGSGTTRRGIQSAGGGPDAIVAALDSGGGTGSAGSHSIVGNFDATSNSSAVAMAISPAGEAAVPTVHRMFAGATPGATAWRLGP